MKKLLSFFTDKADKAEFKKGYEAHQTGNHELAFSILKPLAEKGHAESQFYIGGMYDFGLGVRPNSEKTMKWYTKAAEQGHENAQHNLLLLRRSRNFLEDDGRWEEAFAEKQYDNGIVHYKGWGVPQSYEEAFKYFSIAAEKGHLEAQEALGQMYFEGKGIPQDYEQAFKWCYKAAEKGDVISQFNISKMYYHGNGVSQNYNEAFEWCYKAALQGHAETQYSLGIMYENGQGVKKSLINAYMWTILAISNGYNEGKKGLKDLEGKMTADDVIKAKDLASSYIDCADC